MVFEDKNLVSRPKMLCFCGLHFGFSSLNCSKFWFLVRICQNFSFPSKKFGLKAKLLCFRSKFWLFLSKFSQIFDFSSKKLGSKAKPVVFSVKIDQIFGYFVSKPVEISFKTSLSRAVRLWCCAGRTLARGPDMFFFVLLYSYEI